MASDKLIGRKLGDYVIQNLLGQGGMAHVYKGYDENLQRYAAVKVIVPSATLLDDELEYRERFMREARAIARLNHPRIVGLYQFGKIEAENLYYMAMAYIEGRDLRQILKAHQTEKTRPTVSELLTLMRDIASALDYAHSMGVIHRDVKPSNIMVTADGHAVLTDFGLALSATEGTTGNTFGSVHYIAPEQAVSSAQASPQSDLYSLGVVLYEMLTGSVPFDDASAMSVALKHISDPPQPPSQINPHVPSQVEAVVMRLLDKDPQRRYASGAQFIHALEAALHGQDDEDTEDLWGQPSPSGAAVPGAAMPPASTTDPRKPTRQVQTPANADARAILGDASDHTHPGWDADPPTHVTDPSKPRPTQPSAATSEAEARGGGRGLLIAALLVVLLLVGAGVGLLLMQSAAAANEQATATAVALLDAQATGNAQANAQATAASGALLTETQASAQQAMLRTETAAADMTMTQIIAEFTAEQMARLTLSATAAASPTSTPTVTAAATNTPSATATATLTATPTFTATPTPTATPTATITPSPLPSATPTPGLRAGFGQPQLLLRYDTRTIVMYNRDASATIAIAGLEFVQGNMRYSAQNLASNGLAPRTCAQVWTVDFTELPRDEFPAEICESRRGFASTGSPFWLGDAAEATFVVRRLGRVLGECPALTPDFTGEQRCVVDLR